MEAAAAAAAEVAVSLEESHVHDMMSMPMILTVVWCGEDNEVRPMTASKLMMLGWR